MNTLKAILNFSYVSPQYSFIAVVTLCYSISSHKDLSNLFFCKHPENPQDPCVHPSCLAWQSCWSLLAASCSLFQPVGLFRWGNSPEGCRACRSSGPRALRRALQDRPCLAGTPRFLMSFFSQRWHSLLSRNERLRFLSHKLLLLFQGDGGKQYHSLTSIIKKLSAFQHRAGSC